MHQNGVSQQTQHMSLLDVRLYIRGTYAAIQCSIHLVINDQEPFATEQWSTISSSHIYLHKLATLLLLADPLLYSTHTIVIT